MPLSLILKTECPKCHKLAVSTDTKSEFLGITTVKLECGHWIHENKLAKTDYSSIVSEDGRKLMPFQIETIEQIEAANGRALIAHEQGLGKTVIADAFLALHLEEVKPIVLVTKTTLKIQHMWEFFRWTRNRKVQVVMTGKERAIPEAFDVYVTTYSMLKKDEVWADIEPKCLILDECQAIKNHLSDQSKAVQKFAARCEYILGLSGTPIENHAGEYFTILNILRPALFPSLQRFLDYDCVSQAGSYGYKIGGLSNPAAFREKTKDFIFRKTQKEVLPDLFALQQPRKFHHVELDRRFNKAYAAALEELEEMMYSDEGYNSAIAIAIYSKLRKITGISKCVECVDYITEHILSTGRKIAVFVHHHAVMDLLEANINAWLADGGFNKAVCYRAGDSKEVKVKAFSDPNSPVMLLSTRAAGEGLDGLQYLCSDLILLERQWNPSKEVQAEKRIARYDQKNPCNFIYMIAAGTIDEYFTKIVEQKRSYIDAALDGEEYDWNESGLMRELAEVLVMKGSKEWKL